MRPSNKLDFIKLGSFIVLKILELVTYKLDLSDSIRITRIQHILVLKSADPKVLLIKNILDIDPKSQEKV